MRKLAIGILLLILGFAPTTTFAIDKNRDSTVVDSDENSQVANNLDSLLHAYYLQQSMRASDFDTTFVINLDSIASEKHDSIYIKRLCKLPTLIQLPYNEVIGKYIDYYSKRKIATVQQMLGLADYYFPMFEEVLDSYNLPLELRYLPVIESALNPKAKSRAGATGIWQFMLKTGRMYKLEVNSLVDDRRDPYKSSVAAAKFLKDLYAIYQDWTLVIAAYNCGPGNVNKAIRRSKGKTSYWDIYWYLPKETRGYVPAFIAANYIMNYHAEHGITAIKADLPTNYDTVNINRRLHLNQVAQVLSIPIDILREMNPQYKADVIPAMSCTYSLKLPSNFATQFVDLEDSIYNYNSAFYNKTPIALISPKNGKHNSKADVAENYVPPSTSGKSKIFYTVKQGDNIGAISAWYGVKTADVKYWNNLSSNRINLGKNLLVWIPSEEYKKYVMVNMMTNEQKYALIGKTNKQVQKTTELLDANYIYYTVQSGDNLWDIARKFPGVTDIEIKKLNNITKHKKLAMGQVLKIKRKS